MKKNGKKRITALLLCSFYTAVLAVSAVSLYAAAAQAVKTMSVTPGTTENPGQIIVNNTQLLDKDGAVRDIDTGKKFNESVEELLKGLENGAINASKDGFFATEDDAKNGVVKIVFDVAGRPSAEPADIVFVVDESGSMNMYTEDKADYAYTVPCMNPEHYYCIEYAVRATSSSSSDFVERNKQFYFSPAQLGSVKNWEKTEFVNAIKQAIIDTQEPGLTAGHIMLERFSKNQYQYEFGEFHYHKDESGNYVKIEKSGSFDTTLTTGDIGRYYSPAVNNEAGCIDRRILAIQQMTKVAQTMLGNNSASRIGYVGFAGDMTVKSNLDSTIPSEISYLNGYDYTRYYTGLDAAYDMLLANQKTGRKTYVVFMTDGMQSDGALGQAKALESAEKIKSLPNTSLYCVGIESGASSLLESMASSSAHFKDCSTQNSFEEFMSEITEAFLAKAALLIDVVGNNYDLICDADHPVSTYYGTSNITNNYYDMATVESGIDGLRYDRTKSSFEWTMDEVDQGGVRLSFYVQLEPEHFNSIISSGTGSASFDTNNSASISYTKVTDGKPEGESTTLELQNPATIHIEQSVVTAEKTADKVGVVKVGEEITYSITVKNVGSTPVENIIVSDTVPNGTEYVENSGGTKTEDGRIVFSGIEVAANNTTTVSFKVKVVDGKDNIVNHALFGIAGDDKSTDANGVPICYTNEVVNTRRFFDLTVSKIVDGNSASRRMSFDFEAELKYYDGAAFSGDAQYIKKDINGDETNGTLTFRDGKADFQLSHGESIVIKGVPDGGSYTVTEKDYSSLGYTTTWQSNTAQNVRDDSSAVEFLNVSNTVVPTGVILEILPYAVITLIAVGGLVAVLILRHKKHKKRDDEERW